MKKLILIVSIVFAAFQGSLAQQIFTTTTTSWTFDSFNGDYYEWNEVTVPGTVLDAVTITAHYFGDFTSIEKSIDLYGYDDYFSSVGGTDGPCLDQEATNTFVIPLERVLRSLDNYGYIYIEADNSYSEITSTCSGLSGVYFTFEIPYCPNVVEAAAYPVINLVPVCNTIEAVSLSATPSGGTFSGNYVSGDQFVATGLSAGFYGIGYTYLDTVSGCYLSTNSSIDVKASPVVMNSLITCPGAPFAISATGLNLVWSLDNLFTNQLDSSLVFTSAGINTSAIFYVASKNPVYTLSVVSYTGDNYATIDHDDITGDDRGGIAVTKDFVYVVGDNYTGRFDLNFDSVGISLPIHDGLFVDQSTGSLYGLSVAGVSDNNIRNASFPIIIEGINTLDDSLKIISTTLLTSPIIVQSQDHNGMFQGAGKLVFYESNSLTWYAIDIKSGEVSIIGKSSSSLDLYGSENWSTWGIAEFDGSNYYASYRSSNTNSDEIVKSLSSSDKILKKLLPDGLTTVVGAFDDVSDMANFTISPWTNRWYFHYEGSGQFGGDDETLGYADASFINTSFTGIFSYGCVSEVDVTTSDCETATVSDLKESPFTVYPNPGKGLFYVTSKIKSAVTYDVLDALGRSIAKGTFGEGDNVLNLEGKKGLFYLKSGVQVTKLIVE